jgi:nitrogen fixation protein NifB
VRRRGAFLVNLMPLISEAAHGTYYGMNGQRGPDAQKMEAAQRACAIDARVMRHCRQCRADAVGRLGDDRFLDFARASSPPGPVRDASEAREERRRAVDLARTLAAESERVALLRVADVSPTLSARVAVASRGNGKVDQHFGHARELLVYDVDRTGVSLVGIRRVEAYCQNGTDDEETLPLMLRALEGCQAILIAKVGHCPRSQLFAAGIEPSEEYAFLPVETAVLNWFASYAERSLKPLAAEVA